MPIKVVELHHHGVRIGPSDDAQAQARAFYAGLLGLEVDENRPDIPGLPGLWVYVGGEEQRTQIHLMGTDGPYARAPNAEEDPTRPHVALAVEDINEARRELEARGVRHWTVRSLVGENSDQVFVPDPFGNIIELHQIGTCRCNRVSLPG
ncbi:MAG: VOC family protein [Thiotrichales bacterium]|nr:VOC family protein [Thiotrichales bacterium]